MRIIAINGSPRKTGNTVTFLNKALEGAASQGAETELIHLGDLNFRGCRSCLTCKLKGEQYHGKCAYKDELSPVLEKIKNIDALILGSPIYFRDVTGDMRSFLERLMYPYLSFDGDTPFIFPGKIITGFIYTMGANEKVMGEEYDQLITHNEMLLTLLGSSESLTINSTNLFNDVSKYNWSAAQHKEAAKLNQEAFPDNCEKAFEMGARFAKFVKE